MLVGKRPFDLFFVDYFVSRAKHNLQKAQETASDIFYTTFEVDFTEILQNPDELRTPQTLLLIAAKRLFV